MPDARNRYSVRTSTQLRNRIRNSGTIVKIQIATSALAIASARNTCGMDQPRYRCTTMPSAAASTISAAFWMFMPAITRDISLRGVRLWISANSGTTKKPANRPMPTRSMIIRPLPGCAAKPATPSPVTGARPLRAKYRSSMNALMPNAPSGTRPISTVRADNFSHSSDPTPVPTENSASAKRYSVWAPPRLTSA